MPKKIATIFLLLSFSASCSLFVETMPGSWNWGLKPRPLTGVRNFPSADTEYGKGFKDGCETANEAVSKGLMSDINNKKYDYKRMLKSSDYSNGWFDGLEQCTYILDWDVV